MQRVRCILSVFFVLLCCLPGATLAMAPAVHTDASGPKGELRLAMSNSSPTVDPAMVADEENVRLAQMLYSGLVRLNAQYQVVPDAAQSWALSSDHETYTFHLRHDMRFSNGDKLTASDFAYSITRSLNPALKSPSAIYLLDIKGASEVLSGKAKTVSGIKVIDPYTLQITARWAVPYLLLELTYPTSYALDARIMEKYASVTSSAWYTNPIGSGPYRLKSWSPNNEIVLVPNKYFSQHPPFTQIRLNLSSFPDTNLYSWVTKNLDVATLPVISRKMAEKPGVRETKMLAIDSLYMNLKSKALSDVRVRRALTLALNRPVLVRAAFHDSVTPFDGYVPEGEPGYDPSLKPLPYDPKEALASLRASGYGGKKFPAYTLYYADDPTDPGLARLAKQIETSWQRNLHITVATQGLNLYTLVTKSETDSLPLYLSGWSAEYPDPHDWLSLQWESTAVYNNVQYSSHAFDSLVESADVTWNTQQRMHLYDEAQQMLVNDAASIPLYIPHRLVYVRPSVVNLHVTGYGLIPQNGNWARVTKKPAALRR